MSNTTMSTGQHLTPEEILSERFFRPETQDWYKGALWAIRYYAAQQSAAKDARIAELEQDREFWTKEEAKYRGAYEKTLKKLEAVKKERDTLEEAFDAVKEAIKNANAQRDALLSALKDFFEKRGSGEIDLDSL